MSSVILMPDTATELNVTGTKFKGDGFSGGDGLHTVALQLNDFVGRIFIQASLAADPSSSDWFNVKLEGETLSYLQYDSNTTDIFIKNFIGNFVWVRAKIDRSYIVPEPNPATVGRISQILMNKG